MGTEGRLTAQDIWPKGRVESTDLRSPDLIEDLERKPPHFGYPRTYRWILLPGGFLFFGLALFYLIPDCVDFASGTLCRPLITYFYIALLFAFGALSFVLVWHLGWKLSLNAEGLEIDRGKGEPVRIFWDQIVDVRRRWSGEVVVTTRDGRTVAAFNSHFESSEELEAFLSGVAWIGRQVPFRGRRLAEALRSAVRSTTLVFKALARDKRARRNKLLIALFSAGLFILIIALLFVFEMESFKTRLLYSGILLLGAFQVLYAYWRGRRNYSDTIEVTRHGVTARSETGATTFLSWDDLAAAELEETAAGVQVRSADGKQVLKIGELKHGPLFWQAFWLMGGARPSDD